MHEYYTKKVTTNKGSRTCGVDKVLWDTPHRKWKGIEQLNVKGYKAKPLKRKSIKKKNGKFRHLGISTNLIKKRDTINYRNVDLRSKFYFGSGFTSYNGADMVLGCLQCDLRSYVYAHRISPFAVDRES